LAITAVTVLAAVAGCAQPAGQKTPAGAGKKFLTVDFKQGQTLRYKFVSAREITLDWGQMGTNAPQAKPRVDKSTESIEMVVSYTPIEVDPYGAAKVKATCESAKVIRSDGKQRGARQDAAETFAGKTWTFSVSPNGKIEDSSELYAVIREAGKNAIRSDKSQGAVKEPDMIYDVIAMQWFLWDCISSRKNVTAGLSTGDQWKSLLSVPAPMILWVSRDVTYRLDEIRQDPNGRIAVIRSSYALSKEVPRDRPVPYDVIFQMSGTFGFLRNYQVMSLSGEGEELFNIDAGRTEKYNQKYHLEVLCTIPLGLSITPKVSIDQNISMELLPASAEAPAK